MIGSATFIALLAAAPVEPPRGVLVDRVVALVAGTPVFLSELREEAVFARALGEPRCALDKTPTATCWVAILEATLTQRLIDEEARRLQIPLGPVARTKVLMKRIETSLGGPDALRTFRVRFGRGEKELIDRLRHTLRAEKMKAEHRERATRWLRDLQARIPVNRLVDLAKDPP